MKATIDKEKIIKAIYNEKRLTVIFIVLFVLSLLPLFAISFCTYPVYDDFALGAKTRLAYVATHDLAAVLAAAFEQVVFVWHTWQGTFSTTFLISLQPAVFDEALYPLTTFFMLFALIGSTVFLLHTVMRRLLRLDGKYVVLTAVPVLFFSIQTPVSAWQAFFWYTAAVVYTFFYSLMLFLLALCIRLYMDSQPASQPENVCSYQGRRHRRLAVPSHQRGKPHHRFDHGAAFGCHDRRLLCLP
ncbi:MAG: hypothetical protein LBI54_01950 [Lachnospiraceae bacterium]|jgi:uncharacterized membrane protein|nr:hypothetical protein [Lachnospiraceae bacterium]